MRKEAAEGGFERRLRKDEGFEGLEVWKLEEGRFVISPYTPQRPTARWRIILLSKTISCKTLILLSKTTIFADLCHFYHRGRSHST